MEKTVVSSPAESPAISTSPLQSGDSGQMTTPSKNIMDALGSLWGDHEFQSASRVAQRSAIDAAARDLDADYRALTTDEKSAYLDEAVKSIPLPDPMHYRRLASKVYTPILAGTGAIAAEMVPGAAAAGPIAPTLGIAAGLAGAHGIDEQLGIRKPKGIANETVQDLFEGSANVALGAVLGPVFRGMDLTPADRALMESAHNMGVDLPAETVGSENPIVGTISGALRVLPGSRQVARAFDEKTLDQIVKAHKSLLENGDVSMTLEQYGNAIQKHLDDFVRENTKLSVGQALRLKNAILSRFGSPLSYEELGQSVQQQTKAYMDGMAKGANALYEHAANSFDPAFPAPMKSVTNAAGKMHLQALESKPQFQDRTTNALLKDLSGATEVEQMVAKRNAEIQATAKTLADQGLDPANPAVKGMIPQPISQEEINAFLDNRTMPLSTLIRLKSDLGTSIRAIDQSYGFGAGQTSGFGTIDSGMLKQVSKAVDEDISTAFQSSPPEAQQAHDAARSFYKFYMGETDKKALQSVLRSQSPETIYKGLIKPGMTTSVDMAKRALPPDGFRAVQNRWVSDFLDTGLDPQTGETNPLTGAFVRKQIQDWTPATINRIMDPETSAQLYKLPEELDSLPDALHENPFFKKILNGPGGPSVIDALYRKGGTKNVSDVMGAMDPEGQQLMRQSFLARLLKTDTHEQVSGNAMDSARTNFGQDMIDMMFKSPEEQKKVGDFINVVYRQRKQLAAVQNPPNTAMGFMAARWFKNLLVNPVQAIMQFGPTDAIARAYYSPTMQTWLTKGSLPIGQKGTQAIANLIAGVIDGGGDESTRPLRK